MMREARGDLVLALDDDSYPEQLDCIARVVPFFQKRAKLAVLHFPQRTDEYPETLAQTNFGSEHLSRALLTLALCCADPLICSCQALSPDFFTCTKSQTTVFNVSRRVTSDVSPVITIHHHYSGQARNEIRIHHRHARNEFWSTLIRCPLPFAVGMIAWRVFSQFRYACKRGWSWVVREPLWWCEALAGISYCVWKRRRILGRVQTLA